ncbi:hypothetical protein FOA52_005012 [Chlamydomonas sp. UWO 241]|nr:hypothetical protein FOA52_005012 [Chlamydomonas sp. UWO 241]
MEVAQPPVVEQAAPLAFGAEDSTLALAAQHAQAHEHDHEDASAFECNVCLELAKEPVVTLCGHLYCWPCLYRWTQGHCYARGAPVLCPVCKAGVEIDQVVPIYGRGSDFDPRGVKVEPVPPRPAGQRPVYTPPAQPVVVPAQPGQQQHLNTLLGFVFDDSDEGLSPEQQHQAFLSRLLLMMGSFVIMCLLLF